MDGNHEHKFVHFSRKNVFSKKMLHKWCNLWPILPVVKDFRLPRSSLSIETMAMPQPKNRAADSTAIPDRLYFKIGDAARICGVKTYVLRFWETQFPQLKPNKSGSGQRLYRRRDVELAVRIKQLVHEEGYTLAGARHVLEQARCASPVPQLEVQPDAQSRLPLAVADLAPTPEPVAAAVQLARAELRQIAELLAAPDPQPVRRLPGLTAKPAELGSLFPL